MSQSPDAAVPLTYAEQQAAAKEIARDLNATIRRKLWPLEFGSAEAELRTCQLSIAGGHIAQAIEILRKL